MKGLSEKDIELKPARCVPCNITSKTVDGNSINFENRYKYNWRVNFDFSSQSPDGFLIVSAKELNDNSPIMQNPRRRQPPRQPALDRSQPLIKPNDDTRTSDGIQQFVQSDVLLNKYNPLGVPTLPIRETYLTIYGTLETVVAGKRIDKIINSPKDLLLWLTAQIDNANPLVHFYVNSANSASGASSRNYEINLPTSDYVTIQPFQNTIMFVKKWRWCWAGSGRDIQPFQNTIMFVKGQPSTRADDWITSQWIFNFENDQKNRSEIKVSVFFMNLYPIKIPALGINLVTDVTDDIDSFEIKVPHHFLQKTNLKLTNLVIDPSGYDGCN